ncbi:uncharacterized protein F4822DRAFT_411545 [Hypoxylon trugodes]|uniref:uncharacterized protein n=1 Tax=Hypoxylon trugodes TaxID=326681 RepID=UPI00219D4B1A|nr:uncharacterized protein F4822DRAFT_411545 [Hypoxylon trugodes]KAI1386914.1 hypothetical protein F4822DRAFT_411545 [Hypoxylon trugodes]
MSNYPYAPPPPAPSTASPSPYPPYSQGPGYSHAPPRNGHTGAASSGGNHGGHGHHRGPGRSEYSSHYYPQQDYSSNGPYNSPQPTSYWQGTPPSSHGHPSGSSLPPNYPPSYAPQSYHPQPSQSYQAPYPAQSSRPAYGAPYGQGPNEYPQPPPQWGEQNHSFSYSSRGGRGGYQSDRSGPPRNSYPTTHHQPPVPLPQPTYGYPPSTSPSFSGPPQTHYGPNNRSHGRGGHAHSNKSSHSLNNDRGEKFRYRDQKPHAPQPFAHQKSDLASAKKKKRKTNTLGLTPGDEDSDDGVDEEKRLVELLGADAPGIPDGDVAKWIAARKANFPTQARIAQKKESGLLAQASNNNDNKEPAAVEVDPVEKEADRLRKRLAKLDRKIEKRKRAPNDEGDEMRSESSDDESDDEKPEALPTAKPTSGFLPPPPITRADPSNHCKYYSTGGICGKKGKCRFVHDPAVREAALQERTRNNGQMTLKQRLLLNDKDQDDMEVIKTIVDMRCNGRLHDPQPAPARPEQKASLPVHSSLPTTGGEANLPPNPYAHLKNADGISRYRKPRF